jgi:hypothetical protein
MRSVVKPGRRKQESRAEVIGAEQAKKAADLKPYVPSAAERWATSFHRVFVELPSGFYPISRASTAAAVSRSALGSAKFYGDRTLGSEGLVFVQELQVHQAQHRFVGSGCRPPESSRPRRLARRDPGLYTASGLTARG